MAKQFKSAYANSLAAAFVFVILMLVSLTVVLVGETLDQIRAEAVPALKELRVAIVEYTRIAQEFRDPKNEMHQVLARVNNIATALDKGEGLAGKLLKDPSLADRSEALLAKATPASDQLQSTLTDVR